MDIFKAYEKQRRYLRRFNIVMVFLALFLPGVVYYTGKTSGFFLYYLIFLEILIFTAVFITKDNESLEFDIVQNKIILKMGIFKKKYPIFCEKIAIVHTEDENYDLKLLVITTQRLRNKFFKPVTKGTLKRYPILLNEFVRIKRLNPEFTYYFFMVKKGGFYKYELLQSLYKNCANTIFTDSSIVNIKKIQYR